MTAATPADGAGGTAAAAESPQDAWKQGVDKLREVTKWLITAFAAAGAVLVGTAPLAGIGQVADRGHLAAVVLGGVLALGSIVWTIFQAAKVLTPEYTTLDDIETVADLEPFRELIDSDRRSFLGPWHDQAEPFSRQREDEWTALDDADRMLAELPANSPERAALEQARDDQRGWVELLEQYAGRLMAMGPYFQVLARFKVARTRMLWGALAAALGIGLFAWGVDAKSASATTSSAAATAATPRIATLVLTDAGRQALAPLLGRDCAASRLAVAVVDGTQPPYTVVSLPLGTCRAVQFVLQGSMGHVRRGGRRARTERRHDPWRYDGRRHDALTASIDARPGRRATQRADTARPAAGGELPGRCGRGPSCRVADAAAP